MKQPDETAEKAWREALARHEAAMAGYLQNAAGVNDAAWQRPIDAGKWTPAQITEHLLLSYQMVLKEIRGERSVKIVTGFLFRQMIRLVFLPKILRSRQLPNDAKAPPEIIPTGAKQTRGEALKQLEELSGAFEKEVLARQNDKEFHLTHHIFGKLEPRSGVEFVAIHTEHHGRQLPRG